MDPIIHGTFKIDHAQKMGAVCKVLFFKDDGARFEEMLKSEKEMLFDFLQAKHP